MTFENPWALLVLLAIPVLIVIYILKNKYRDETAPSTYIWEVSKQFLKKVNPIRKIEHLLALIVECLAIAGLSITLAHPEFTLKGQAENVVFILDNSASMNMKRGENTKFAEAIEEIKTVVEDSAKGSTFTLITAGQESEVVCERIDDKSRFNLYLDTVKARDGLSDIDSSLSYAQNMFSNGLGSICYLLTDQKVELDEDSNIEYIDYSTEETNRAITNASYEYDSKEEQLNVTGEAISYGQASPKTQFEFYINDVRYPGYLTVDLLADSSITFKAALEKKENIDYTDISKVEVKIVKEDCYDLDNSFTVYPVENVSRTKVLLVTDTPLYLRSAFQALGGFEVTVRGTNSYRPANGVGYDIYVFDSYAPSSFPTDGAVWLFNCATEIENCGYIYQKTVNAEDDGGIVMKYAGNTDDRLYNELTKSTTADAEIPVKIYQRYTLVEDFTTIMNYDNIPLIFAGKNEAGQKEVVFSFALNQSSLPLKADFLSLVRNLATYSHPKLLSQFDYQVYDTMTLALSDSIQSITITTPEGEEDFISSSSGDYVDYLFEKVGTYSLEISYTNTTKKDKVNFFVKNIQEEGNPFVQAGKKYALTFNENYTKGDGIFDNILPWVIAASVLFSLDWVLYAHEQY